MFLRSRRGTEIRHLRNIMVIHTARIRYFTHSFWSAAQLNYCTSTVEPVLRFTTTHGLNDLLAKERRSYTSEMMTFGTLECGQNFKRGAKRRDRIRQVPPQCIAEAPPTIIYIITTSNIKIYWKLVEQGFTIEIPFSFTAQLASLFLLFNTVFR